MNEFDALEKLKGFMRKLKIDGAVKEPVLSSSSNQKIFAYTWTFETILPDIKLMLDIVCTRYISTGVIEISEAKFIESEKKIVNVTISPNDIPLELTNQLHTDMNNGIKSGVIGIAELLGL